MKTKTEDDILKYKGDNKSLIFLYPILQLKVKGIKPIGVYLDIEDSQHVKPQIICLFHKAQKNFTDLYEEVKSHKRMMYELHDDDYVIFAFDFSQAQNLYNAVLSGRYTTISGPSRTIIQMSNHPIGDIGLNPHKYYAQFAEDIGCSEAALRTNVELVSSPDMENEILSVSHKALAKLNSLLVV